MPHNVNIDNKPTMEKTVHLTKLIPAALLLLMPLTAAAQDLDEDVIDRWANSMEQLEAWGSEQEDLDESDFVDESDPSDVELSMMRTIERHDDVRDIAEDNGFEPEVWASLGGRIVNAYGALTIEDDPQAGNYEEMQEQMNQQIEAFEQDPNVTDEQIAMVREQMESALNMMERMYNAPEADVDAVRANRDRLDELFAQPEQEMQPMQ